MSGAPKLDINLGETFEHLRNAPIVESAIGVQADATYRLAVAAGAKTIESPVDTPYGDRRAMIDDLWGNTWQIATRKANHGG